MNPIPPIAKGADMIHAGIVQNLERADLVLCDMSSLNANVFFELGIRTAIGKPVCVVKDDTTPKVPFDMTVVNYHVYSSALNPWSIEAEIEKLVEHLKESIERSAGENLLWKYFSLSQRAQLPHPTPSDETLDRLAMLSAQVEGLSKKMDIPPTGSTLPWLGSTQPWQGLMHGDVNSLPNTASIFPTMDTLIESIRQLVTGAGAKFVSAGLKDGNVLNVNVVGLNKLQPLNISFARQENMAVVLNLKLAFTDLTGPPPRKKV